GAHDLEGGVDAGDDFRDGGVGLLESGAEGRHGGLRGDGGDAGVEGEAERDDPFGGGVGVVLHVVDDGVEQFVDGLEVGAAHVPVGLLDVDHHGFEVDDD